MGIIKENIGILKLIRIFLGLSKLARGFGFMPQSQPTFFFFLRPCQFHVSLRVVILPNSLINIKQLLILNIKEIWFKDSLLKSMDQKYTGYIKKTLQLQYYKY